MPVVLSRSEGDHGLGFSVMAGGVDGSVTVVERVWDRRQCTSLQPGDAIVKINGADVQSLSFVQVLRCFTQRNWLLKNTVVGFPLAVMLKERSVFYSSSVFCIRKMYCT